MVYGLVKYKGQRVIFVQRFAYRNVWTSRALPFLASFSKTLLDRPRPILEIPGTENSFFRLKVNIFND
jgi:hypothetical protein